MPEKNDFKLTASIEENDHTMGSSNVDEVLRDVVDISPIKGANETAKAIVRDVAESKKQIDLSLADAQARLVEISAAATQVLAVKAQIASDQAVIATKSDHIQKAQEHADSVRANLDRVLTGATQHATEVEGQKSRAQMATDTTTELLTAVRTTKATVEQVANEAVTALKDAQESARVTKGLAGKATTVEARIAEYENQLASLKAQCEGQLKTIESLLPGATSAGLAHAFDERRQTFIQPQQKWEKWFVGSVALIVALAVISLLQIYFRETIPTWDEVGLLWLSRLPVAGALIWLALHASHEAALAKRLEEDYGYKSAIASSFLGFHKQMSEIGSTVATNVPLGRLCQDTLTTIASPPGRIYDKHNLTVSPGAELREAAKVMGDVVDNSSFKGKG